MPAAGVVDHAVHGVDWHIWPLSVPGDRYRLVSRDRSSYLKGNGYLNYAAGFAQVRVLANAGGSDRALLRGLTSVETLFATEALAGRTSLENHSVEVEGFASVVARYAAGQTPHREIDAVDFVLLDQALS